MGQDLITCPPDRVAPRGNPFQRRRFASQTKPIQECHPERSEGSLSGERSFAPLRMTKRDDLLFEMYWPQGLPLHFTHQIHVDEPPGLLSHTLSSFASWGCGGSGREVKMEYLCELCCNYSGALFDLLLKADESVPE